MPSKTSSSRPPRRRHDRQDDNIAVVPNGRQIFDRDLTVLAHSLARAAARAMFAAADKSAPLPHHAQDRVPHEPSDA
jgi:hypothetical protein